MSLRWLKGIQIGLLFQMCLRRANKGGRGRCSASSLLREMASRGQEHTVVHFSKELNRLNFNESLPGFVEDEPILLGLLPGQEPNVKASVPCEHIVGKPCYEQCERSGRVACPLGGDDCSDEEVVWMNPPARSISEKQVICWNKTNGCNTVTAAVDNSKHFHHECEDNSARCPKSAAEINASDVHATLESCSDAAIGSDAAGPRLRQSDSPKQDAVSAPSSELSSGFQGMYNAISMNLSSIQTDLNEIRHAVIKGSPATSLEEDTGEKSFETKSIQESLRQTRIEMAMLKDEFDEFTQNMYANQQTLHNCIVEQNEALKQSLTDTVKSRMDHRELAAELVALKEAMGDGQSRLVCAIDRQNDLISELLRSTYSSQQTRTQNFQGTAPPHVETCVSTSEKNVPEIAWAKSSSAEDRQLALALLPSTMAVATTHTWTLEGYQLLKQRAGIQKIVKGMLEPVYLRGYCVSFGIVFYNQAGAYFYFELHEGKVDRYLNWPFDLQIKWSILHPQGAEKLEYCMTPRNMSRCRDLFLKPKEASDSDSCSRAHSIAFSPAYLESWGFIENGRMVLRLSLEDPTADEET